MNCPPTQDWDLLAMEALADEQAASLFTHARECPSCRELYAAARREHVDRVRMYEAFDRDHDKLREQLMATLPAGAPQRSILDPLARGWGRLGDFAMSLNKTTGRRAAALLIPVAAVLFIALFVFSAGQKSAFAAAIEHLRQARTIVCRVTMPEGIQMEGTTFQGEGTLQFSEEFGSHFEIKVNDMVVSQEYAPPQGPVIVVQPATKTWIEIGTDQVAGASLDERSPEAFLQALRKLTDDSAIGLGEETIEGRAATGYRVAGEKLGFPPPSKANAEPAYAELWVDTLTQLPAKLLVNMPMAEGDKRLRLVYDRFGWDAALAASLFQPNIPEDYHRVDAKLARPDETALVNALKRLAYFTGRYPPALTPTSILGRLHKMVTEERRAEFEELDRSGMVQLGMEIGGGTMYYMKLVRDGRKPEYFGDEVTPDDANEILLRWQLDDGKVRVIYGDLRAETLPAE
ncbi:MAG TPA: hypothetical protein VMV94_16010 [Phycisphaerae bacterium]|nr:hypothetical protein [Phycisphaerae bacterium]